MDIFDKFIYYIDFFTNIDVQYKNSIYNSVRYIILCVFVI